MKHLKIMLMAIGFVSFATKSQAQEPIQTFTLTCVTNTGTVKATDTASATDTIYMKPIVNMGKADSNAIRMYSDIMYDWSVVPGITATTTGTVSYWGSNTGLNPRDIGISGDWVALISNTTQYNGASTTSISGTSTIYGKLILPNCQFKYVYIRYISSGAGQTSTIRGKMYSRPHG